jgi:hypothetical protein
MRLLGFVLVSVAVLMALALGLLFASQTSIASDPSALTGPLATGFFAVTALAASGVVLIVRAGSVLAPRSTTALQRSMTDALHGKSRSTFPELAVELGVETQVIEPLLRDLTAQGLWSGVIAWKTGDIYPVSALEIANLGACPHCDQALNPREPLPRACSKCGSIAYSIE